MSTDLAEFCVFSNVSCLVGSHIALLRFCDYEQQAHELHSPSRQSLLVSWEFFTYKCSHPH